MIKKNNNVFKKKVPEKFNLKSVYVMEYDNDRDYQFIIIGDKFIVIDYLQGGFSVTDFRPSEINFKSSKFKVFPDDKDSLRFIKKQKDLHKYPMIYQMKNKSHLIFFQLPIKNLFDEYLGKEYNYLVYHKKFDNFLTAISLDEEDLQEYSDITDIKKNAISVLCL